MGPGPTFNTYWHYHDGTYDNVIHGRRTPLYTATFNFGANDFLFFPSRPLYVHFDVDCFVVFDLTTSLSCLVDYTLDWYMGCISFELWWLG
jgi:hypothetical protein